MALLHRKELQLKTKPAVVLWFDLFSKLRIWQSFSHGGPL